LFSVYDRYIQLLISCIVWLFSNIAVCVVKEKENYQEPNKWEKALLSTVAELPAIAAHSEWRKRSKQTAFYYCGAEVLRPKCPCRPFLLKKRIRIRNERIKMKERGKIRE